MIRAARLRIVALSLMLAGSLVPNFAFADTTGEIEMQVDGKDRMTIQLNVAGQDIPAVLDTAATFTVIDVRALDDWNSRPLDSPVSILGVDGLSTFDTTRVGPVMAGDMNLGSIEAAINAKPRFVGHRTILPVSALTGRSVDFNFTAGRVEIHESAPRQPRGNIVSRLKYSEVDGLLFVPVSINGKKGRALIDTGSDVTYVNSAFAKLAGAKPQVEKTRKLFGTAKSGVRVQVFSARKFKVGAHKMSNFDILSADPPLFEHLGMEEEPVMVLGLDVLRKFRFQIDRERKRVLLGRKPSSGSARHFHVSPQQGRARRDWE